jgi:hypothetical protein
MFFTAAFHFDVSPAVGVTADVGSVSWPRVSQRYVFWTVRGATSCGNVLVALRKHHCDAETAAAVNDVWR